MPINLNENRIFVCDTLYGVATEDFTVGIVYKVSEPRVVYLHPDRIGYDLPGAKALRTAENVKYLTKSDLHKVRNFIRDLVKNRQTDEDRDRLEGELVEARLKVKKLEEQLKRNIDEHC